MKPTHCMNRIGWGVVLIGSVAAMGRADFVSPMIGGGSVGMGTAPMKHVDITFVSNNIQCDVDTTGDTPVLRPLTAPHRFDSNQPWAVLIDKAYNYQYAFNSGGFITLPANTGIWVERLSQDSELQVYMRPPQWTSAMGPTWTPIFLADHDRWQWSGSMQHNAYAVLYPTKSTYSASYKVYIGDATTGDPVAGYGFDTATFNWTATPVPEPGTIALLALGALLAARRRGKRAV